MKGPYTRTEKTLQMVPGQGSVNQVTAYSTNLWYRTDNKQKVRNPLPWQRFKSKVIAWPGSNNGSAVDAINAPASYYAQNSWGRGSGNWNSVYYKAWARFQDRIRSTAGVGQNLVEYKQTLSLLQSTVGALRKPFKTFAKAARRYFQKNGNTGKTLLKDTGDAWLAFHFGVEPLIKDLYAIMERLNDDSNFKWHRVTASGKDQWGFEMNPKQQLNQWTTIERYIGVKRISAEVRLKSPQLALLNDFGLINPASLAWEVVPFSFVVDWFIPIGSYLNSFTDLLGYELRNPSYTTYLAFYGQHCYNDVPGRSLGVVQGVRIDRSLWLPPLKFPSFRIPDRLSPSRAATSIALLLQALPKR